MGNHLSWLSGHGGRRWRRYRWHFRGGGPQHSIANNKIFPIEALYSIQDGTGDRSFTAQIQGNENDTKGFVGATNTLNGAIIDGWRLGSRVHVKYESFECGEPNALGGICYLGTIRIMPASAN